MVQLELVESCDIYPLLHDSDGAFEGFRRNILYYVTGILATFVVCSLGLVMATAKDILDTIIDLADAGGGC